MSPGSHGEGMPLFALIADADDGARAELVRLLARLNYEAVEAVNGEQALEIMRERPPALVVLDVALPGGSAYEICRGLREAHGQRLPIAFVSAHRTQLADEVAGLLIGADEYFAKPIQAQLFLARMRRLIARSAARHGLGPMLTPREREVLASAGARAWLARRSPAGSTSPRRPRRRTSSTFSASWALTARRRQWRSQSAITWSRPPSERRDPAIASAWRLWGAAGAARA